MPTRNYRTGSQHPMKEVLINSEPVELYKILKFEGLVSNGGEAKAVVGQGQVRLNGKVETQKRKKIVAGDVIEFGGEKYSILLGAPAEKPEKPKVKPAAKKLAANQQSSGPQGGPKIRRKKPARG